MDERPYTRSFRIALLWYGNIQGRTNPDWVKTIDLYRVGTHKKQATGNDITLNIKGSLGTPRQRFQQRLNVIGNQPSIPIPVSFDILLISGLTSV